MSVLTVAALAVGLLLAVPVIAHLLRRGQIDRQAFPPARLVPARASIARKRTRLEDRALLSLRALMIVALAVLGATPLVRCSRLSLARDGGASLALAIVIDDSASMRLRAPDDRTRFEHAIEGAEQLLQSIHEGDAVSVVLAGAPARLALSPSTDLAAVRRAIEGITPADRSTSLAEAIKLARSALEPLPQSDRRVVVLSDLADSGLEQLAAPFAAPLDALTEPAPNCGVASAERRGAQVTVEVGCATADAARDRTVGLVSHGAASADSTETLPEPLLLEGVAGVQTLVFQSVPKERALDAMLSGTDRGPSDDRAPVSSEATSSRVGVVADAEARVITGGPTVVEQALAALELPVTVHPLPLFPETTDDFEALAALVTSDPPGLSPAARQALVEWVERGGVTLALLGPRSTRAQLASTLEPYVGGGARWEPTEALSVDPGSAAWLGAESRSLEQLARTGRTRLDGVLLPGSRVLAAWSDGAPWLVERTLGRGVVFTCGLPASVEHSDLPLRPAFLALLEHVVQAARARSDPRRSLAGARWTFPGTSQVSIRGPDGPLDPSRVLERGRDQLAFVAPSVGRYQVHVDRADHERVVTLAPSELTATPAPIARVSASVVGAQTTGEVDASGKLALVLLGLFALELVVRARGAGVGRRRRAPATGPASVTSVSGP